MIENLNCDKLPYEGHQANVVVPSEEIQALGVEFMRAYVANNDKDSVDSKAASSHLEEWNWQEHVRRQNCNDGQNSCVRSGFQPRQNTVHNELLSKKAVDCSAGRVGGSVRTPEYCIVATYAQPYKLEGHATDGTKPRQNTVHNVLLSAEVVDCSAGRVDGSVRTPEYRTVATNAQPHKLQGHVTDGTKPRRNTVHDEFLSAEVVDCSAGRVRGSVRTSEYRTVNRRKLESHAFVLPMRGLLGGGWGRFCAPPAGYGG